MKTREQEASIAQWEYDTHEYKSINPNKEPLTVEKLRTMKGFENINDEEANDFIQQIDQFCRIVYEYFAHQQQLSQSTENEHNTDYEYKQAA